MIDKYIERCNKYKEVLFIESIEKNKLAENFLVIDLPYYLIQPYRSKKL